MRLLLLVAVLACAGCNTVRGAGEDLRSIGRVFSDHPDGAREGR